jgi:uncharacterized protein YutE (UPF0331/DUF86 family)
VNEHLIAALASGAEHETTRLTCRDTFLKLADHGVCPSEFAERIAASAGLRNILVHYYNDSDHRVRHGSIRSALEDCTRYVELVHGFVTA